MSRRGSSSSKRWPAACPWSSPGAGRFARSSRGPEAESWWSLTMPRAWPTASTPYGRTPSGPRKWAAGAPRAFAGISAPRTWPRARSKRSRPSPPPRPMLEISNVTKQYPSPRGPLTVLSGVSLALNRGEAAAIMGPSGSGKSTLLYIAGALEPPTAGTVTLGGVNPYTVPEKELSAFRNQSIGFVFQDHCLLPQCSVLENVLVPTLVANDRASYPARARELLRQVGLEDRLGHRPAELSGGEKQRVALARAL